MFRGAFLTVVALCSMPALAIRHIGFETDAFNRAFPVSYDRNIIFSPASFEVDCALIAESLPTIPKAGVSELLGVVLDFESTYQPVVEIFSSWTNGFSLTSARGFCIQDIRTASPDHRNHLSRAYGAAVMRSAAVHGAESWFRAAMNGEMEDFEIPVDSAGADRYSFYDLVSLKTSWLEPFPTNNSRKLTFYLPDGSNTVQVACMADVRLADTWETEEYVLLKLPLRGDAWFYAMLPKPGFDLVPLRSDLSSLEIDHLLAVTKSVTEKNVGHGPCAIVLPKFDLYTRLDVMGILRYFRVPTRGLVHVAADAAAREYVQHVRFRLSECAWDAPPLAKKGDEDVIPITPEVKRLVFNRPFLFFVYHEKTETILVAGQYSGK